MEINPPCGENLFDDDGKRLPPCIPGAWIIPAIMACYLLVANVLLVNLLIAVFNNTFLEVISISNQVWKFQRYQLILTFHERPVFPPPLIVFSYLSMVVHHCCRRKGKEVEERDRGLKLILSEEELKKLQVFEEQCVEQYFTQKEDQEQSSNDERIRITADRVENMAMRLEEVNEREHFMKASLQTVDIRLAQLEEFSGRMVNAMEKLAGIDKAELTHTRSRCPSECDASYLIRQNSTEATSMYRFHMDGDDTNFEDSSGLMSPLMGSHRKTYSAIALRDEKELAEQKINMTPKRRFGLHQSSSSCRMKENSLRLGVTQDPRNFNSCVDIFVSSDGCSSPLNTKEETNYQRFLHTVEAGLNGQLVKEAGLVTRTTLKACLSFPLEKSKAANYFPSQSYGACQATVVKARSVIFGLEGMVSGPEQSWSPDCGYIIDHVHSGGPSSTKTPEWVTQCEHKFYKNLPEERGMVEGATHPTLPSSPETLAEQKQELTDTEDDIGTGRYVLDLPPPRVEVPRKVPKSKNFLTVTPDRLISSRSKSLHGRSRKTMPMMEENFNKPKQAFSTKDLRQTCGDPRQMSRDPQQVYRDPRRTGRELVVSETSNVRKCIATDTSAHDLYGTLLCTNFKISFITKDVTPFRKFQYRNLLLEEHDISLTCVDQVVAVNDERKKRKVLGPNRCLKFKPTELIIYCKDFRIIRFRFDESIPESARKICLVIAHYSQPKDLQLLFGFAYAGEKCQNSVNGTDPEVDGLQTSLFETYSDWDREIKRTGASEWRVCSVNEHYATSTSLPEYFVVPSSLADEDLKQLVPSFNGDRIPVSVDL
ncbi:hypothetical protein scyTo_0018000 [Scyliorhinus torazame]|uniref:Myotubularin phosphatase domain-containing protein n=1 Tax=Scyliorhinus torazame TaxID=75743 RepID=A0A401Q3U0_SCYTO|nr:hypothetical protein [Scyliorhinus torazame]